MNDEIKEILDEYITDNDWIVIATNVLKYLKDYITNLQKENEELKEENKQIFSKVNDDELLISNAMNYAEAQDYKSRIEKAVEYIKTTKFLYKSHYDFKQDLLNILQNGSENQ